MGWSEQDEKEHQRMLATIEAACSHIRSETDRYRAALLNLYGQVDQARTGFGIYADSPSMNAAMEETKALLHPTQPAEGGEKT